MTFDQLASITTAWAGTSFRFGPTAAIFEPSINGSAAASKSLTFGSSDSTTPPLSNTLRPGTTRGTGRTAVRGCCALAALAERTLALAMRNSRRFIGYLRQSPF